VIDGHRIPVVAEIIAAIQAGGYACQVGSLQRLDEDGRTPQGAALLNDVEGYVTIGGVRGWMPANLPKLGANGSLQYLIAKWE